MRGVRERGKMKCLSDVIREDRERAAVQPLTVHELHARLCNHDDILAEGEWLGPVDDATYVVIDGNVNFDALVDWLNARFGVPSK